MVFVMQAVIVLVSPYFPYPLLTLPLKQIDRLMIIVLHCLLFDRWQPFCFVQDQ